ncbi:MAG: phage integrase SAM-like domain-containing protein [Bacteroidales bacterium]|nr:phage integrase SAM-like domain-containing protein [Bacteroidales bacterium]MBQ8811334.1 phage integrase SAM-like domain-containing protein [Bacteroidales bacterium]
MPVRFYLYPVPNKKGECPIRVSISIGSTRFMTGIGYNCATEAWEDGHGVKARYTNSKGVSSKIINACISNIQAHFTQYEVNRFVHFLRVKRNLEEKTVQKQFNNLKWFLNWAIRKGYCKEEYINKYRPKYKVLEKPVIFLTKEELLHLYIRYRQTAQR